MTRSVFGRTRLEGLGKVDSLRAQRGQRADGGRAECGGRNQLSAGGAGESRRKPSWPCPFTLRF